MHGYEQELFEPDFLIMHTGYAHSDVRQAKLLRNLDLLEKSEKNYHVCFCLGKTFDALGKRAKALKYHIRAIKALEKANVQPDMLYASIVGVCKCLLDAGKTKACEAMARRAIDMRPYDVRGWHYLGKSLSDLEAYTRGLECRNYLSSMQTHHEWYHVQCLIEKNLIRQGVRG
jgi:tetratricopeptide (TPR) repeat protein